MYLQNKMENWAKCLAHVRDVYEAAGLGAFLFPSATDATCKCKCVYMVAWAATSDGAFPTVALNNDLQRRVN